MARTRFTFTTTADLVVTVGHDEAPEGLSEDERDEWLYDEAVRRGKALTYVVSASDAAGAAVHLDIDGLDADVAEGES